MMKALPSSTATVYPQISIQRVGSAIARYWAIGFILVTLIWVTVPWLAPVFMKLGWEVPARVIYSIYSFQCHQLPQRSFFLFGPSTTYSLEQLPLSQSDIANPLALRQFIGAESMGYKVAWSDRMVSAYSSIPLAAIIWVLVRKRVRPLSIWFLVLLALPMVIDGGTHMISDLAGIGAGFRYTNTWLADLTSHVLPASFYAGTTLGSFNSWMRLLTGVLFGFGLVFFAMPHLYGASRTSSDRTEDNEPNSHRRSND